MKNNFFNSIRNARISAFLITFLSTAVVFAQPAIQYSYAVKEKLDRIAYVEALELNVLKNGVIQEESSFDNYFDQNDINKQNINYSPETQIIVKPLESVVNVGVSEDETMDNPIDNVLTVFIPDTVSLNTNKVILSYKLLGLADAGETTKSINRNAAYGGKVISKSDQWKEVSEVLPSAQLVLGKNEIYFTRRDDVPYEYSIKDVTVKVVPVDSKYEAAQLVEAIKYNDSVYVLGSVTDENIIAVEVLGELVSVNNGVFEITTARKTNLGDTTNITAVYKYKDGHDESIEIEVTAKATLASQIFDNSSKRLVNKLVVLNEAVSVTPDLSLISETGVGVTIRNLEFKDIRLTNSEMVNVTSGRYGGYRVGAFDKKDSLDLVLHVGFDVDKIPFGYSKNDVKLFFYDKATNQWEKLDDSNVDYENNSVSAHFIEDTEYMSGVIKTPEMAENGGYVSTSLGGLEYASPAAGVVSIPAPSPNSSGSVNTGFPIKLPAGRNGLQPSLGVNYNSDAGNGWMGLGWNTGTPAITLNTKWGVPRFEETIESEMYLLDGADLLVQDTDGAYVSPNRREIINRINSNTRQFYLRKEGSYVKIERKGNNTKNYYWVVTDKRGVKYYYGGENNVVENTVVRTEDDAQGNLGHIVHWALYKVVDPFGNYMLYNYDNNNHENISPGVFGKSLYINNIQYTKNNSLATDAYYKVSFKRNEYTVGCIGNCEGEFTEREDVIINGRNGVLYYTKDLLTEIWVEFFDGQTNSNIRKYRFNYETGAFKKSLLKEIAEYDMDDDLFYSNTIGYYDTGQETGVLLDAADAESWTGGADPSGQELGEIPFALLGGVDNPFGIDVMEGSALGTSSSSGWMMGTRVGVGIGYGFFNKIASIGGGAHYAENTEKQMINLLDINGDGLPDRVYDSGGSAIRYRENTGTGFRNTVYNINGINKLSKAKSRTVSGLVDGYLGVTVGKGWSKTRTDIDGYFIDMNGDGLPDVIKDGLVRFNITDPDGSDYHTRRFDSEGIEDSENVIFPGAVDESIIDDLNLATMDELRYDYPQFDAVKVWQAPYSGKVRIEGQVQLISKNPTNEAYLDNGETAYPNVFKAWVEKEHNGNTTMLTDQDGNTVRVLVPNTNTNTIYTNFDVTKGDYVFFRMHNDEYGSGGYIKWAPRMIYATGYGFDFKDENGKSEMDDYDSFVHFLPSGGKTFQVEEETDVTLDFNITAANLQNLNLTDDVDFTFKRVRYYTYVVPTPPAGEEPNFDDYVELPAEVIGTYSRRFNHISNSLSGSATASVTLQVNDNYTPDGTNYFEYRDVVFCIVESSSNVNWELLNWEPIITNDDTNEIVYPGANYMVYNDNIDAIDYAINPADFPDPDIQSGTNTSADDFLVISHNIGTVAPTSANTFFSDFDDMPQEIFPIPLHWVVKQEIDGVVQVFDKETYYIERVWDNVDLEYDYTFEVLNDEIILTRGKVETLQNATSSRLFVAFYSPLKMVADLFNTAEFNIDLATGVTVTPTWTPISVDPAPFLVNSPNLFGQAYRGWGQFLYNGGIEVEENEEHEIVLVDGSPNVLADYGNALIDMSVFPDENGYSDFGAGITSADDIPEEFATKPRYALFSYNTVNDEFYNEAYVYSMIDGEPEQYSKHYVNTVESSLYYYLGRFAQSNLYDVYIDPDKLISEDNEYFAAIRQYSEAKGTTETFGFGPYTKSVSNSTTKILNSYLDLNGDRYPDLLTSGKVQYTNMLGGLYDLRQNGMATKTEGYNVYQGATVSLADATSIANNASGGAVAKSSSTSIGWQLYNNASVGLGKNEGDTTDTEFWADMNGDGLPDKVGIDKETGAILVQLSTGYGYSTPITWGTGLELRNGRSNSYSISASDGNSFGGESDSGSSSNNNSSNDYSGNGSWSVGLGFIRGTAEREGMLIDVNGDGLVDWVQKYADENSGFDGFIYRLNTGNEFSTTVSEFYNEATIKKIENLNGNVFGTGTYGFTIFSLWGINFKLNLSSSTSVNTAMNNHLLDVKDLNGDGYVDVIKRNSNNVNLHLVPSAIGETNLIKKVNTPLGGSWEVSYTREGNTYDMPQSKYVLAQIKTHDGFEGDNANVATTVATVSDFDIATVSYEDGKYDRRERAFLGFGKVRVNEVNPTDNSVYRYSVTEYHTDNIYLAGRSKQSYVYSGSNEMLSSSKTIYNILDPDNPQENFEADASNQYLQANLDAELLDHSRLFVAAVLTQGYSYEGTQALSTESRLYYDSFGNVTRALSPGDTYAASNTMGGDGIITLTEYYTDAEITGLENATGLPKRIEVHRLSDNQLMRKKEMRYTTLGQLKELKTTLNPNEYNTVIMGYDGFGNLIGVEYPESQGPTGHYYELIYYDDILKTFPVSTSDAFEYTTAATYDYLFGNPVVVTDTNGKQMRTRIDDRGRVVEVTGPNEMAANSWTVRMEYENETALTDNGSSERVNAQGNFVALPVTDNYITDATHHAVARHNDTVDDRQLLTVSIIDGLGKPLQIKKTHYSNELKWMVSAVHQEDAFGRVVKTFLPGTATYPTNVASLTTSDFEYIAQPNTDWLTTTVYDVRNRVTSVHNIDNNGTTTLAYGIEEGMFTTEVITPNNQVQLVSKTFTDVRGRTRKTVQNGELTTRYYYNAINELMVVKDHQGYETQYAYDMAGRIRKTRHPDRGLEVFVYNEAGNIIERSTSNLLTDEQGQQYVRYFYTYDRLDRIEYPNHPEENVRYEYGNVGDADAVNSNALGRLFKQYDATGVQTYSYDNTGNLQSNLRSVAVAGRNSYWFYTQWNYDSFGRIRTIVYPDGERVNYGYNEGGDLERVDRNISSQSSSVKLVNEIKYNDYGERISILYGNGTRTLYDYDTQRRLEHLRFELGNNFEQDKRYTYDDVSNVTKIETLSPASVLPGAGDLGGPSEHNYRYDNYNRLVRADGYYTGPDDYNTAGASAYLKQEYRMDMAYDLSHNIISKNQRHRQGSVSTYNGTISNPQSVARTSYNLTYNKYATGTYMIPEPGASEDYAYVQPHAPREIVEMPTAECCEEGDATYKKTIREYDANGNELSVKEVVGNAEAPNVDVSEMTLYRNVWDAENRLRAVDLNPDETKEHQVAVYTYDDTGERIIRYTPGRTDVWSNGYPSAKNKWDAIVLYPSSMLTAKAYTDPADGQEAMSYTKHYYMGSERIASTLGTKRNLGFYPTISSAYNVLRDTSNDIVIEATEAMEQLYVGEFGITIDLDDPVVEGTDNDFAGGHIANKAVDTYFYHTDHLGSSSYITNIKGIVSQHMEYIAFGELLVDEHLNSNNSPFKFNAKRLDAETGNLYYGARYYNPKTSIWLSVDPMADMYPGWSPYNYCMQNPVNMVDPTGMFATSAEFDDCHLLPKPEPQVTGGDLVQVSEVAVFYMNRILINYANLSMTESNRNETYEYIRQLKDYNKLIMASNPELEKEYGREDFNRALARAKYCDTRVEELAKPAPWELPLYMTPGVNELYMEGKLLSTLGTYARAESRMLRVISRGKFAPWRSRALYHYTSEAGYNAIMESKVLNPSIGVKNARFGSGQYFTDIVPGAFTRGETSYRLYRVPWNKTRLTHYIKIETRGLNIIQNKPFNFLHPSSTPLDLNGRILGGGATGF